MALPITVGILMGAAVTFIVVTFVTPDHTQSPQVLTAPGRIVPGLSRETLKQVTKKPSLIERVKTKQILPTQVLVSADSLTESSLKSVPFGIVVVKKQGTKLQVTSLNYQTGASSWSDFTLPSNDRDYTLRAGENPPTLRTDRNFGVRLGGDIRLQLPLMSLNSGLASPSLTFRGPVKLGTERLTLAPYGSLTLDQAQAGLSLEGSF